LPAQPSATDYGGAESDPLLGRLINDRYRIVEQIGQGGMGRVYKTLQSPLERVVALKVLGAGHDRDPNFYKRFFLEASVTAKLTHPNTITLYDYGRTEDGIFFIAMEYLNGRTLSAAMQQDGPLAQERVIHIAQQICRSLREAHALGIVHRDLKPANVMLLRQHDDHDFVKVLDFGLVKFFSGDNPEGDITNAGTFMGSPHYIAPEQARNHSPDQRCDIYSLGVLLYHMLTGKVPFTAQAPVDIILKHLHEAPVPPRELRPELQIAEALQEIVLKCMAKSRDDRFQSMDELLAQLKAVRAQVTGLSAPTSTPPSFSADGSPDRKAIQAALVAQTPSQPQPSLRTPSQPMSAMRTPAGGSPQVARTPAGGSPQVARTPAGGSPQVARTPAGGSPQLARTPAGGSPQVARTPAGGSPRVARTQAGGSAHVARPPPPPPEAMIDEDPLPPQKRVSQAMRVVRAAAPLLRRSMLRPALVIPAALAVGGVAGLVLYLRSASAQVVVQQIPAVPDAVASISMAPPVFTPAAPAPEASSYRTANAGTTLVTVTSTPSGAEVRDADDRLLGMTPFDLRVPAAQPLQLTLRHEGFKPVTLKKKVEGERVSLSVTMKKDARADPYEVMPHKRSVGYKDDPY
jgi:serine/threonine-protein kinase